MQKAKNQQIPGPQSRKHGKVNTLCILTYPLPPRDLLLCTPYNTSALYHHVQNRRVVIKYCVYTDSGVIEFET
jgi:hypothetical protein